MIKFNTSYSQFRAMLWLAPLVHHTTTCYASPAKDSVIFKYYDAEGKKYQWKFKKNKLNDITTLKLVKSWNYDKPDYCERIPSAKVKYLIIHYTVADKNRSFQLLCSKRGPVSVHYIIDKYGTIYDILDDSLKAYHAGVSKWGSDHALNDTSIGIENINSGFESFITDREYRKWYPFNKDQIDNLGRLCRYIVDRYDISPTAVLAHADIAPNRKEDPGPLFPWWYLYEKYGVGAWCTKDDIAELHNPLEVPNTVDIEFMSMHLYDYGYTSVPRDNCDKENIDYKNALRAFKLHFSKNQRPEEYEKEADIEDQIYLYCLCKKYGTSLHITQLSIT